MNRFQLTYRKKKTEIEIGMAVDRVRLLATVPLCLLALALALLAFDSSTPTSQGTTLSAAPAVLPFLSSF